MGSAENRRYCFSLKFIDLATFIEKARRIQDGYDEILGPKSTDSEQKLRLLAANNKRI